MSGATVVERKYALVRISAGDYLLPSNDAKTLWRITAYDEDGSAVWVDRETGVETPVLGRFWRASYYNQPLPKSGQMPDDYLDDWSGWTCCEDGFRKRGDAVSAALSSGVRR